MSNPLTSPVSGPLLLGGLVVGVCGVVLMATWGFWWGAGIAVLGLLVEFSGASWHDHRHRRRGEVPHAMWGAGDRNRPHWLPRRRRD